MEFEVSYTLENAQQFWDELDDIVSKRCHSHELIDDSLRAYLSFTTTYREEYVRSEDDVARCSLRLLDSPLFAANQDYVRRQIVYCLLQEDMPTSLHFIAVFLLFDGRQNETTFEMMNEEGAFPRLLELIPSMQDVDVGLHKVLLQLLYEMSRIQQVRTADLLLIDDDFIERLLQLIEGLSDDVNDPYHYPVIRVLLILNEQYMVSAHHPAPNASSPLLSNKVIKVLCRHSSRYKTFGENIILLLNRESETSLQLLILKLLYLLFTTGATYEYFYTNDLRVLVDVVIRNLLDLPLSSSALRHTYLRVLYPLLAHTQLRNPENHYKREELLKLLYMMTGTGGVGMLHFGAVDDTTKRLVGRCAQVPWLRDGNAETENAPPPGFIGIGMHAKAAESCLSVVEVAVQKEKPGVQTPSRGRDAAVKRRQQNAGGVALGDGADSQKEAAASGNGNAVPLQAVKSPFEVEGEA